MDDRHKRWWIAGATVLGCVVAGSLLAGWNGPSASDQAVEVVAPGVLELSVDGQGELRSAKATPLSVPGTQWASRRLVWMLPEGSQVKQGELLARFSADDSKMGLAQALLDQRRNALARAAKENELHAGQGRVAVDLSKVAVDLAIAQRYAHLDDDLVARNDVLDAVQDTRYLGAKRTTLVWKRGQSGKRGGAELAVLDAQRATIDSTAQTRQQDLDALELRAPHAGVLMLTPDWSGEKPAIGSTLNAGQELGNLPDASAIEMNLALPQIEAQGIKVGTRVEMHPVGRPEQAFTSKLSWVASAAKLRDRDSPVKYLSMKAAVPASAIRRYGLVPGQRIQARVVLLRSRHALSVANVALDSADGRNYVQVRDGGRFVRRAVTLGVRGNARSQVLGGLHAGDEVMLAAADESPSASASATASGADRNNTSSTSGTAAP